MSLIGILSSSVLAGAVPAGIMGLSSSFLKVDIVSIRSSEQYKDFKDSNNKKFGSWFADYLISTDDPKNEGIWKKRAKRMLNVDGGVKLAEILGKDQIIPNQPLTDQLIVSTFPKIKKRCKDKYSEQLEDIPSKASDRKEWNNVFLLCSIDSNPHWNAINSRKRQATPVS